MKQKPGMFESYWACLWFFVKLGLFGLTAIGILAVLVLGLAYLLGLI